MRNFLLGMIIIATIPIIYFVAFRGLSFRAMFERLGLAVVLPEGAGENEG